MGFLLGMELQIDTAGAGYTFEHRKRMPHVLSVFQPRNHRLRRANHPGELYLRQTSVFAHLADQQGQVNLVQGPRKDFPVSRAPSSALLDDFRVLIASHWPNSLPVIVPLDFDHAGLPRGLSIADFRLTIGEAVSYQWSAFSKNSVAPIVSSSG
jgi:hypothetical protein